MVSTGDVLAGRYRLESLCHEGPWSSTWRATDEVLARPVAVKIVLMAGPGSDVAADLLTAAGRASELTAAGLARVYDAATEVRHGPRGGRGPEVAYVISEWVEGRPLHAVLAQDGPLDPSVVARIGGEVAAALHEAHERGVTHGRVHPGNLLIGANERAWLTDTAVAATLAGTPSGRPNAADVGADTRDLAACLYAALTGRWPGAATNQPDGGLPHGPVASGYPVAPRLVRAGIPRVLDEVLSRALCPERHVHLPPVTTPAELGAALAPIIAEASARADAARRPAPIRRPSWLRRTAPWIAGGGFIVVFATSSYFAGRAVGELPPPPGGLSVLGQQPKNAAPGAVALVPYDLLAAGITVRDYDPDGDGHEMPSTVVNAYDQDPITAWTTATYSNAAFGGLKAGVGLLVDFGRPVPVRQVGLGFTTPGATIELRAGDALGTNEQSLPVVLTRTTAATAETLVVTAPVAHRYWLVWISHLPDGFGDRSRVGISAMVFSH